MTSSGATTSHDFSVPTSQESHTTSSGATTSHESHVTVHRPSSSFPQPSSTGAESNETSPSLLPPAQKSDYLVPTVIIASVGVVTVVTMALVMFGFMLRRRCRSSKPSLTHACPSPRLGLGKYLSPGHMILRDPHNSAYPLLNSSPSPLPSSETKVLHFVESQSVGVQSPLTQSQQVAINPSLLLQLKLYRRVMFCQ